MKIGLVPKGVIMQIRMTKSSPKELKAIEVQQEHEKWHDLADDLPPEDGFYITYQLAYRATDIYEYNKEANVWNDGAFNIHPSHWKHLPPEPVVGKNE